jgi:phosphatidylglycerophosphate synthase
VATTDRPIAEIPAHGPTVGFLAQAGILGLLAVGAGLGPAGWVAGTGFGLVVLALLSRALKRSGMPVLGPANTVTLVRATMVGGVTALVADSFAAGYASFSETSLVTLVAVAAVALALDGVDGQVARRTGTVSRLGARFDMETDAFLILVLSAFCAHTMGAWVLLIGAMRYAFVAVSWVLPWLNGELPHRFSRKVVAATQGIVLVVAASDFLPAWADGLVLGAALASLVWSFGRDIALLWLSRPRAPKALSPVNSANSAKTVTAVSTVSTVDGPRRTLELVAR